MEPGHQSQSLNLCLVYANARFAVYEGQNSRQFAHAQERVLFHYFTFPEESGFILVQQFSLLVSITKMSFQLSQKLDKLSWCKGFRFPCWKEARREKVFLAMRKIQTFLL